MRYALKVKLSDGFTFALEQTFNSVEAANREAASFMRHYSDPCGVGARVEYVSVIDQTLAHIPTSFTKMARNRLLGETNV